MGLPARTGLAGADAHRAARRENTPRDDAVKRSRRRNPAVAETRGRTRVVHPDAARLRGQDSFGDVSSPREPATRPPIDDTPGMTSLTESERTRCEQALSRFLARRRPPPHLRHEIDLGYRINGQSIEIHEVRARLMPPNIDPFRIDQARTHVESPIAKATLVRAKDHWRVFWRRSDMQWHAYEPHPIARSIEEFVTLVDEDRYACFFG